MSRHSLPHSSSQARGRERGLDTLFSRSLASLFNPVLYPEQATEVQLSQEEVGYLTGISRQRANQALQVLEKAGLLKVEYGRIRILDLEGLRSFT